MSLRQRPSLRRFADSGLRRPLWGGVTPTYAVLSLALIVAGCKALDLEPSIGFKNPKALDVIHKSPNLADLDTAELEYPWSHGGPEDFVLQEDGVVTSSRIGGDELVALNFRDVPLAEALALISDRAGINMILDPGLNQPINASFPAVTLDNALRVILDRSGFELVEEPAGIFWVRDLAATGGQVVTFTLGALSATDAAASLTSLLGSNATVIADTNQNMVVVRGDRDVVSVARTYLERADRVKPQVLIEVQILEAKIDENFEFGVAHLIQGTLDGELLNVSQNLGTQNAGLFSGVLNFANGDVRTAINALQDYVDLEVLSTPCVLVVTNHTAKIEVIQEVPYVEVTTDTATAAGGNQTTQETIAYKNAGIMLEVLPVIQDSGILQITIKNELSEIVGRFRDIPIVDKRTLETQFMVSDRQTIVLGGLMQDRRTDTETGVPLLKDLPLLGRLFRSDVDSNSKRELLVFVTPRIVNPNEAAVLARRYQAQYEEKRQGFDFDATR